MVVSFVGRSVILLRSESKSVNYSRRMLYPMLPNALDSRMARRREVSFSGHTLVLCVHVHASLLCLREYCERLVVVLTRQQRVLDGLLIEHI